MRVAQPRMARALAVGILVLVLGAAPATAARLFVPRVGLPVETPGIGGVRFLSLDRSTLADIRTRSHIRLTGFPLGGGGEATLVLQRFSPFGAAPRIETMTAHGPRSVPVPDVAYFTGTLAEDPAALVLLAAGRRRVNGFVAAGGDVHLFGPDAAGRHRAFALRNVDPTVFPRPRDFCTNDLVPEGLGAPGAERAAAPDDAPATAEIGTLRLAQLAIETDNELRAKFASAEATVEWLGTLLAAATMIYERDLGVRLELGWLRLWEPGVPDPWASSTTSGALNEVVTHWRNAANGLTSLDRDAVHLVSGKSVSGGIAYLGVLCAPYWAFGVSQVFGSFDLASPSSIWDVEVFTHELGHNFGSPHTHCYVPPLDHCYAAETNCYAGPTQSSRGTIMSYCHLHPGGLANIDLEFGPTVSAHVASRVAAAAACLPVVTTTTTTPAGSSTTTTTTSPGATTTTTTTQPAAATTSTTSTTTSSTSTTSSTTLPPTTTSTTPPPIGPTDGDADGVPAASDACPDTPAGELVDATGCSVCPCAAPREGGTWRGRGRYLRCVRAEVKRRGGDARAALRAAQKSTCGRYGVTRCCVTTDGGSACRLSRITSCRTREGRGEADDAGAGSCRPSPCDG